MIHSLAVVEGQIRDSVSKPRTKLTTVPTFPQNLPQMTPIQCSSEHTTTPTKLW